MQSGPEQNRNRNQNNQKQNRDQNKKHNPGSDNHESSDLQKRRSSSRNDVGAPELLSAGPVMIQVLQKQAGAGLLSSGHEGLTMILSSSSCLQFDMVPLE